MTGQSRSGQVDSGAVCVLAMSCGCRRRRPLLPWIAVLLICCGTLLLVLPRYPSPQSPGNRALSSACRAAMAVRRLPPMSSEDQTMITDLMTYLTKPDSSTCRRKLKFGGLPMRSHSEPYMDGHKYVCMDPEFSLHTSAECLVYSFGISIDWSFDWDVEAFGCSVFAFDPSINATADSRGGSIVFRQDGVGGQDGVLAGTGERLRTLETFVQQLGHRQRVIHYLKMDVEDAEWAVFRQQAGLGSSSVLATNVEQLGVELHFMDHQPAERHVEFYREVYRSMLGLQEMGFYLFWYEPNPLQLPEWQVPGLSGNITYAMEVVWLKTRCLDRG